MPTRTATSRTVICDSGAARKCLYRRKDVTKPQAVSWLTRAKDSTLAHRAALTALEKYRCSSLLRKPVKPCSESSRAWPIEYESGGPMVSMGARKIASAIGVPEP